MTAPDYVARVAELLEEHAPDGTMNRLWCRCGWEADGRINGPLRPQHTTHQAEVLATAGLIPTTVEWGVRVEGPRFDQTRVREGFTEEQAAQYAADECLAESVVSRAVTDWKGISDD